VTATVGTNRAPAIKPRRAGSLPADERRAMIVEAMLPLLLQQGEMVTTREIAEAAGIAEGTIFRAFPDKDALIAAVVEAAFDTESLDEALAAIDPALPFDEAILLTVEVLQRRVVELWRIASSIGTRFHDTTRRHLTVSAPLKALFEAHPDRVRLEPEDAARLLRAFTLSVTHPTLVETPMKPAEIVELFLDGAGAGDRSC
jgi:AcrR family transcriptional regulator